MEGVAIDQRYLFHGTDESLIAAICEQNFDWRSVEVTAHFMGKVFTYIV